jgi:hypothetical protein
VYVQYCIIHLYVFLDFDTIAVQGLFSLRPIHKLKDRRFPGLKKAHYTIILGPKLNPKYTNRKCSSIVGDIRHAEVLKYWWPSSQL